VAAVGERALSKITEAASGSLSDGGPGGLGGLGLKGPVKALVGAGLKQTKDKAKDKVKEAVSGAFGGGGGGGKGKKLKVVNIVEQIDVGVPVSVAYNQWTQFEDFPTFMKKVEDVNQQSETELDWKAQIFLSHRKWTATITEQVPDERIVWESRADKGHVNGAVTFHEVAPHLTRVLLVLQYYPQGLFERTGNIWRAQGRRARLELKHYRRHVMTETILHPDELEGWRGEIHEGEVVPEEEQEEEQARDEEEEEVYDEEDEEDEEEADEDRDQYDEEDEDEYEGEVPPR